jgi:PAS domain S-box-containing protein
MAKTLHILIVEDSEDDALLIVRALEKDGYEIAFKRVETEEEMRAALDEKKWDIILADYKLPAFSGMEALKVAGGRDKQTPFILVSGTVGESAAVECIKAGANNYIIKGSLMLLGLAVQRAIDETKTRKENIARGKALMDSVNAWDTTFNSMNDAVCLVDKNRAIKICNYIMAQMFGRSQEDLIGENCCNLIHGKAMPVKECPVTRALETRKREIEELHLGDKWVSVTADPVFDSNNEITSFVHIVRDITDSKTMEASLKISEMKYRRLFETARESIIIIDLATKKILDANPFVEKLLEYDPGKIIGKEIFELSPIKEIFETKIAFKEIQEKGFIQHRHISLQTKRGERIYVEFIGKVYKVGDRDVVQLNIRDITAYKKAEEALLQSEIRFKELFENMMNAAAVYGAVDDGQDFIFREFNKAAEGIEKAKKGELIGKRVTECFPGVKEFGLLDVLQRVWKTGRPEKFPAKEYKDNRISGWRENKVYKMPSGEIVAIYEDLTEEKLTQNLIKEKGEKLEQALDISGAGIWEWDLAEGVVKTDNRFSRMLGYGNKKMKINIGEWEKVHYPGVWDERKKEAQEYIDGGKRLYESEHEVKKKNGGSIWIYTRGKISERGAKDEPLKFVGIALDVTKRKRAEGALAERQRLIDQVGEIAKIGGWEMDLEKGGKATWTKGIYKIVEVNVGEPVPGADEHVDWYLPEYRQMIKEKMQKLIKTRQPMQFEAMLKTKKGTLKWCQAIGEAVERDGKVVKLRGTFQDITERKRAMDALKESEQRFKTAVLDSPHPILIHAEGGEVIQISRSWTDIAGYTEQDIPTLADWTEKAYGKKKASVMKDIKKLYTIKKRKYEGEHTIRTKDGRMLVWEFSSAPLGSMPDGRRLVISIANDVTKRKGTEEALRESEERFRTTFERAADMLFLHDQKGNIIQVNNNACKNLGYTRKELGNMKVQDIEVGFSRKELEPLWRRIIDKSQIARGVMKRKDGTTFPVEVNVGGFDYRGKKLLLAVSRDITERERLEYAKVHLMRDVTHGLKTPIAISQMALYVCNEGLKRGDVNEVNEAHAIVANNLKLLRKDIDNILTSTTVDMRKGEKVSSKKCSSLKGIAKNMTMDIKGALEKKRNIEVKIKIAPDANKVAVAPRDIKILLNCLIDNAAKFTEKGAISIISRPKKGHVELEVKDTGCGISKKHLGRIFEKFYKRHPAVEGTGLGLSICKDIAEMYNGEIEVKSEGVGKGTTVLVRLPKG